MVDPVSSQTLRISVTKVSLGHSWLPDVDSTLRQNAQWKHISDLTSAYEQSMNYHDVATPFNRVRVYKHSAMRMPGSETAIEEIMCHALRDLLQEGIVTKIADDFYCKGNSPQELLQNWKRVLQAVYRCDLRLGIKNNHQPKDHQRTWLDLEFRYSLC